MGLASTCGPGGSTGVPWLPVTGPCPPLSCLRWRKTGADEPAPTVSQALLHPCHGMCAAGHGSTKYVLLSTANILLLFVASSPGQAQERGRERGECRHAGARHAGLLERTPGRNATPPRTYLCQGMPLQGTASFSAKASHRRCL